MNDDIEIQYFETHLWPAMSILQRITFYSAVYMASYPQNPRDALGYLLRRVPGVPKGSPEFVLSNILEPQYFIRNAEDESSTGLMSSRMQEAANRLILRDFGGAPASFKSLCDLAFDPSPRNRMPFVHDVLETVRLLSLTVNDITGDSEDPIYGERVLVLNGQKWDAVVAITTDFENRKIASWAASLSQKRKIIQHMKEGTWHLVLLVAPAFGIPVIEDAEDLDPNVHLVDFVASTQLKRCLSDSKTAEKVAKTFPTFCGKHGGILDIAAGLKALTSSPKMAPANKTSNSN